MPAIFNKACYGGHKDIVRILVDHVKNKDDEESQSSLEWKSCLFKENPFAQRALIDFHKDNKKNNSKRYHLGEYLQKLKTEG